MYVIGLTGGIGSGKSTICDLFKAHGIDIIDADVIARKLTETGSPHLENIADHFGAEAILEDGSFNRAYVRQCIFSDPSKRIWLESLLHPLIRQHVIKDIEHCKSIYCIAAIPLLVESTGYYPLDRILVIDTHREKQIKRVIARDNCSKQHAENIVSTQANADQRLAIADDIIHNNGTLENLKEQVDKLHARYTELAKKHEK